MSLSLSLMLKDVKCFNVDFYDECFEVALLFVSKQFHPLRCTAGLILGLRPANERQHYFVMTSLIGWAQT